MLTGQFFATHGSMHVTLGQPANFERAYPTNNDVVCCRAHTYVLCSVGAVTNERLHKKY